MHGCGFAIEMRERALRVSDVYDAVPCARFRGSRRICIGSGAATHEQRLGRARPTHSDANGRTPTPSWRTAKPTHGCSCCDIPDIPIASFTTRPGGSGFQA
eukprot:278381-Chlamydomonas_euryale.AAC.6